MKKGQPIHCILLKVLWFVLVIYSVYALITIFRMVSGVFEANSMLPGISAMFGVLTVILSIVLFKKAFEPELTALRIKKDLYVQDQTKHMQEEYLSIDADIQHRSIKKKSRSVKQGLLVEKCPKCGDEVDANENFCGNCGQQIYKNCKNCKAINSSADKYCRNCGEELK